MQVPCNVTPAHRPAGSFSASGSLLSLVSPSSVNASIRRPLQLALLALVAAWSLGVIFLLASGENGTDALMPVARWRIEQRVQPAHALVQSWANHIRTLSTNPSEQAALAEQTVWHLVRYWDETDVWDHHYIPRIDEMAARAHAKGWETLRGNCISQSIALCSLLRALGVSAHIEATPSHAWVEFVVNGHPGSALRMESGPNLTSNLPVAFSGTANITAARALGANPQGQFEQLLALPDAHELAPYFERPAYFLAVPIAVLFWIWFFREWDRESARRFSAASAIPFAILSRAERIPVTRSLLRRARGTRQTARRTAGRIRDLVTNFSPAIGATPLSGS